MTAENTSCEFDPHATSMGDEVAPEVYEELFAMRRSIDNFDAALVHILAERFQATKRVGILKAKHNLNFIISEVIRHHVRIANERAEQDGEATEAEKSEG